MLRYRNAFYRTSATLAQAAQNILRTWVHDCHEALADPDLDWESFPAMLERDKDNILDAVRVLDEYLTGHTENRRGDDRRWTELVEQMDVVFYLSDGGYSRLVLDLYDGKFGLDRGLSTKRVLERWDALE